MKKCKISVIIPVYNTEEYIEKCIESVINQTYRNLEIILVNDGSTDGSLDICKRFQIKDDRIIVIDKENQGLVAARKTGVKEASGEYIAFVDSDDWIDDWAYERITEGSNNEDVVMFGMVEDFGSRQIEKINAIREGHYDFSQIREDIIPHIFGTDYFFYFGILPNLVCKLIRRTLMLNVLEEIDRRVTVGEDVDFTCHALAKADSVNVLHVMPYHYVQRQQSMMRKEVTAASIQALFTDLDTIDFGQLTNVCWKEQMLFYKAFILQLKQTSLLVENSFFYKSLHEKKLLIYGAGNYGFALRRAFAGTNKLNITVTAMADRDWMKKTNSDVDVIAPEDIMKYNFDYVYIAILNEKICENVRDYLIDIGIEQEKIIYYKKADVREDEIDHIMTRGKCDG